jgi:phosphoglycerate kinase
MEYSFLETVTKTGQKQRARSPPKTMPLVGGSLLRRIQDVDLRDKIVLVRVDHNTKRILDDDDDDFGGLKIADPFRIESSIPTLYCIIERGGRPIVMTHVNRPRDKKTKKITVLDEERDGTSAIARYLSKKLGCVFASPRVLRRREGEEEEDDGGIEMSQFFKDGTMQTMIEDLKARRIGGIYLPNVRWFSGEERGEEACGARLAREMASMADVFVNDAFGSWQPHVSTFEVAKLLPSYAGLLMQRELDAMRRVLEPKRPFVAVVAGSKVNTKIGTLINVAKKCDAMILGGVIYNAYLSAKYGVKIKGVDEEDVELARKYLVNAEEVRDKLLELPTLVESKEVDGCGCVPVDGRCTTMPNEYDDVRLVHVKDMKAGNEYGFINDVAPVSYLDEKIVQAVRTAKTILVNAVMGYTSKGFHEGTVGLDELIRKNIDSSSPANVFFGGGDTLQEFKSLSPGSYLNALENPQTYLFTGGGTVLKVIEEGEVGKLDIVRVLTEQGEGEEGDEEMNAKSTIMSLTDADLYDDDDEKREKENARIPKIKQPKCNERVNCDCSDLNAHYPEQRL